MTNKNKTAITTKRQLQTLNTKWAKKRIAIIIVVVIAVWLILDLLIGGNIRFYAKWAQCGQKPVVATGSSYEGEVPNYKAAPTFSMVRLSPKQFCTARAAELRGYSANKYQYQFLHTTSQDRHQSYLQGNMN